MQVIQHIPAVWVHTTDPGFNRLRPAGYGAFLTQAQQARLDGIHQGRQLFDGQHRTYFLDERRTQFHFPDITVNGQTLCLYLTYNVLGLISVKGVDLLFGQEPLLAADDPIQQHRLSALAQRTRLHPLLRCCAADATYERECFLESVIFNGEVYLQQVPADEIFPLGDLQPDLQYRHYIRYSLQNLATPESPLWILLEVTYLPGRIERHLYQLTRDGRKAAEIDLAYWPSPVPLHPLTLTGIAPNTITWIPNQLVRGQPVSDYDGAIELQDALNAKNSQVGRVLAKHSDPKLAAPMDIADPQGNLPAAADLFFFRDPTQIPRYITWDAQLAYAIQDRAFTLNNLLIRTETSPVLLGLKEGAAPDAYKKVRLEAYNSITKAQRKAAFWKAGIIRAVETAQALENTLPGVRYPRSPIGVELRDGIPVDDLDQAHTIATLRAAGAMSRRRSLEIQLIDPAAVQKELTALDHETSTPNQKTAGHP